MIKLNNVVKTYGEKQVIKGITYNFEYGKIYGIVGKNGVGKTTLLKLIAGLANVTAGTLEREQDDLVGCCFNGDYYEDLKVNQNIVLRKQLLNKFDDQVTQTIIKATGLENNGNDIVRQLSLGNKQILNLSMAFIGHPKVVIFDEPFSSLDPVNVIEMRKIISNYVCDSQAIIIISSHDLLGLQKIASDFIFLREGEITQQISLKDIDEKASLEEIFYRSFDKGGIS